MVRASRVLNLQWMVALGGVAFLNQSLDFPPERLLVGESLLQAGAG